MARKQATTTVETAAAPIARGRMERRRYEFVLEAAEPIAHASESIGNESIANRAKTRQPDGSWAWVPEVSGDAARHGMREAAAYTLLDAAGILDSPSLSEAALRLLFAGGMVTGRGDASVVKLDEYREMCELIPSMAIFGGCANNRVNAGRSVVEPMVLICRESTRFTPARAQEFAVEHAGPLDSCRAHIEEVQRVRMDPTLVPEKRMLLADGEQVAVDRRLAASEAAHDEGDAIARDATKSKMLPRRFERVARGSLFYWACEATTYSDLDVDTFNLACAAFAANMRVGGKRATGHGLMRVVRAWGVSVARPADAATTVDTTALAPRIGELFRAHVAERRERIASFLAAVDA